jgi:hypothetical protein
MLVELHASEMFSGRRGRNSVNGDMYGGYELGGGEGRGREGAQALPCKAPGHACSATLRTEVRPGELLHARAGGAPGRRCRRGRARRPSRGRWATHLSAGCRGAFRISSGDGAWRTGSAVGRLGLEDERLDDDRVEGGLRIATVPGQVRTAGDGSTTTILVNSWQKKRRR